MRKIERLSDRIEKEIECAMEYARCAIEAKEDDPDTAEVYYKIAENKLNDMMLLHNRVTAVIQDYRKMNGDPPGPMQMLYNILHRKHIESTAAVKGILALYKEP